MKPLSSAVLLAGLWLILTNGAAASWLVGLPALAAALWVSRRLSELPETRISLTGLARFVPFFLWESLRGGVDVALRTLAPRMRIRPGFTHYHTGLKTRSARTLFANCVSLLPGTLAADLQGEWLEVHMLNTEADPISELTRLERVVAKMFTDIGDTP